MVRLLMARFIPPKLIEELTTKSLGELELTPDQREIIEKMIEHDEARKLLGPFDDMKKQYPRASYLDEPSIRKLRAKAREVQGYSPIGAWQDEIMDPTPSYRSPVFAGTVIDGPLAGQKRVEQKATFDCVVNTPAVWTKVWDGPDSSPTMEMVTYHFYRWTPDRMRPPERLHQPTYKFWSCRVPKWVPEDQERLWALFDYAASGQWTSLLYTPVVETVDDIVERWLRNRSA